MISILIVCEGNICRSPYVERVLRARLDAVLPGVFRVDSAGTAATAGTPMFPRSAAAVGQDGGDPDAFVSTPLTAAVLRDRDLVLTLERAHRAQVLDLAPHLLRRTFTIAEFDRLVRPLLDADAVDERFWAELPRLVSRFRVATAPTDPALDDVADPARGDEHDFLTMRERAISAIATIAACAERAATDQNGADRARTARP
ncbi:protein-tyrosine phosphatase [Curtobacterium sp. PhB142]|uniref:arsenate reductase/protein-tyrosine-phosphatase family protein n=1 Tax=unclassified Curtobacterium TaxID=257496 RepID=UPI0010D82A4F|nr:MULTISPECIES: low molecular weight phosphatase family protein [unclassified Curtobacterium]TCL78908.1 protein-tyrosine phosphatase [Curtobacterium sp. PhB142]TCL99542.1 protein-tyrosine phosphatase [Curtobacterium sp. PhB134]TCU44702.1 protein-tyrosine phosphatase [Curtobacterium sp. PhB146]